ncbi:acyl-coA-sterol acyltransferase [Schizosaccharomyces cryophilus OY26]|uniref:O-acyltransferase n=1 Tax=Schizosaccharomyces cryophilus (strain OY26 / ATCC MYA-4695 / CBS 11777 / NBRC 106824 / NRRL Y48691) TaxID=653667 RepID=S9WZD4_SCHCR|nr:acyl-coA-sterol acyltransferase [Schizosaccharomyces cryophilus OY26]EPY50082.1 acyl-coA-sterol acyltransferase [Schizosaccharomyces cryophilus OY26]
MIASTPAGSESSSNHLDKDFGISETKNIDHRHCKVAYRPLDYSPTPSIFARTHQRSNVDFTGFFVLFWVSVGTMILIHSLDNMEKTGKLFGNNIIQFFKMNLLDLAKADLFMSSLFFVSFPFQKLFSSGTLRWYGSGIFLYSALVLAFLMHSVLRCCLSDWPWTHRAVFILHSMDILMKIHSYNTVNGWFSYCYYQARRLRAKSDSLSEPEKQNLKLCEESIVEHGKRYPNNLTFSNALTFLFMPILCYQLYYPRTPHIRVTYLLECALGTFGCIFLLVVISENYMIPVLLQAIKWILEAPEDASTYYFVLQLGKTVTYLMFPFMLSFLIVFWVIFEGICNFSAEITRFADRNFYDDWWNCWTWDQFARTWNKPVHYFLLRHVYCPFNNKFSKFTSTTLTFLVSSILHELVMGCITKKIRGYGLFFQMTQIPYMLIQRQKYIRKHRLLGNVSFWVSIIIGLSLIGVLYILY